MGGPGKPLSYIQRDYLPLLRDPARRYMNIHTGEIVSRRSYENSIARKFGFRNIQEYAIFNQALGSDLGGLDGLRPKTVNRARKLLLRWERDNRGRVNRWFKNNPEGNVYQAFGELNPYGARWMSAWINESAFSQVNRSQYLNHLLDFLGIRKFTPNYLPGDTP